MAPSGHLRLASDDFKCRYPAIQPERPGAMPPPETMQRGADDNAGSVPPSVERGYRADSRAYQSAAWFMYLGFGRFAGSLSAAGAELADRLNGFPGQCRDGRRPSWSGSAAAGTPAVGIGGSGGG